MKELARSARLALISLPISLLGGMMSMGLAHSSIIIKSFATLLLLPAVGVIFLQRKLGLENLNGIVFVILALLAQFLGYLAVIHTTRLLLRSKGEAAA